MQIHFDFNWPTFHIVQQVRVVRVRRPAEVRHAVHRQRLSHPRWPHHCCQLRSLHVSDCLVLFSQALDPRMCDMAFACFVYNALHNYLCIRKLTYLCTQAFAQACIWSRSSLCLPSSLCQQAIAYLPVHAYLYSHTFIHTPLHTRLFTHACSHNPLHTSFFTHPFTHIYFCTQAFTKYVKLHQTFTYILFHKRLCRLTFARTPLHTYLCTQAVDHRPLHT